MCGRDQDPMLFDVMQQLAAIGSAAPDVPVNLDNRSIAQQRVYREDYAASELMWVHGGFAPDLCVELKSFVHGTQPPGAALGLDCNLQRRRQPGCSGAGWPASPRVRRPKELSPRRLARELW